MDATLQSWKAWGVPPSPPAPQVPLSALHLPVSARSPIRLFWLLPIYIPEMQVFLKQTEEPKCSCGISAVCPGFGGGGTLCCVALLLLHQRDEDDWPSWVGGQGTNCSWGVFPRRLFFSSVQVGENVWRRTVVFVISGWKCRNALKILQKVEFLFLGSS